MFKSTCSKLYNKINAFSSKHSALIQVAAQTLIRTATCAIVNHIINNVWR